MSKWIATVHAIGITKINGNIKVYAPYGLSDIYSRTIRPIKHNGNSKELYDKMRAGSMCKTSQANQFDAITKFNDLLNQGYDILHLCFSSGVSSVFVNTSEIALEITGSSCTLLISNNILRLKYSLT